MTLEQTLAFLGFSLVMAGTPGPSNTLLTATGASVGVLRGVPAVIGVAVGMGALMLVVALGLGTLILQTPLIMTAVKWIGAAFLLWLAWKIATSDIATSDVETAHASDDGAPRRHTQPVGLIGAAGFQWINPKSWLACTSAAATFIDPSRGNPYLQAATIALLFVLVALPSCFVWLAFGAVVQRGLRSNRAARTFNLVMAALLAGSVGLILF